MTNKILVGVAILIFIVGAVIHYSWRQGAASSVNSAGQKVVFKWDFKGLGEDSTGMPSTEVTLTMGDKKYPLGKYSGSCAEIDGTSWALIEGEKAGVVCWFAGGGEELGIFEEGGKFVVKKGQLDEGTAEMPGLRGNFKTLVTL